MWKWLLKTLFCACLGGFIGVLWDWEVFSIVYMPEALLEEHWGSTLAEIAWQTLNDNMWFVLGIILAAVGLNRIGVPRWIGFPAMILVFTTIYVVYIVNTIGAGNHWSLAEAANIILTRIAPRRLVGGVVAWGLYALLSVRRKVSSTTAPARIAVFDI